VADDDETTVDGDRDAALDEAPEVAAAPSLTRADLQMTHRNTPATPVDGRLSATLLVVVLAVGALLVAAFLHADVQTIADDGWQGNALWAAGVAVVLLGLALGVLAWTIASASADSTLARTAVVAAVLGVVGAVLVLGLADEQGGQLASSDTPVAPQVSTGSGVPTADGSIVTPEPPIALNEALEIENLTSVAFPVTERVLVSLELTNVGRDMLARAMGCRPSDLGPNTVLGTVVGGTWVQPLVIVGPPVREDDTLVARCHRVATRLPTAAGFAVPRF
jgi:hypothetical protein